MRKNVLLHNEIYYFKVLTCFNYYVRLDPEDSFNIQSGGFVKFLKYIPPEHRLILFIKPTIGDTKVLDFFLQ